jgi:hypothetical protein
MSSRFTQTAPEVTTMSDLIPSLAFTALLELHPEFPAMDISSEEYRALRDDMVAAMKLAYERGCQDLWKFAEAYLAAADEHRKDAVTPTDLLGSPFLPGRLLVDCTCGNCEEVPVGPDEGTRADAAHRAHRVQVVMA